ncbi:hypothetical protein EZV62_023605 [Acer yangbiense]|uniref:Cytochrome P450 n=1 Tax=Acer yangbiense TaxID=1000413 RepID=A0A5C7H2H9_9ROSI|nr:hypothetical protein EZV62_023605 [Acer yangbiense]
MKLTSNVVQNLRNSSFNISETAEIDGISITLFTLCATFALILYSWKLSIQNPKQQIKATIPAKPARPPVGGQPSLRLGNKIGIVVTSPSTAHEVLKQHDINFANRDVPAVTKALSYGPYDIVWSPYGPEWRMLRKVCVIKMLSNTTLDSVYGLRRREVREMVSYMYGRAATAVNVGEQMFLTMLNVITNMSWGGTVQGRERANLGAEFRQVISEITQQLVKPNISEFYPSLARFDLQGIAKKMKGLSWKIENMLDKVIDQRLEMDGESVENNNGKECKDFLQFLLRSKEEGDSKTPLTMIHVKALLMDMVVGGSETTSNSVEFAMVEVMNKHEVMRKAQQELEEVVGKDKIVEKSHIHKLPYSYAVMKEVLRLHPALPLLVPHCPSETCTVGGYTIPKGCQVFVNVWAIHRDPSVWEDPLGFNPDRFLNGIAMAERMFMYSIATLLHSFDWKLPEGEKVDLTEKFGIVLKLKNPLVAIPTPRLSDPTLYE